MPILVMALVALAIFVAFGVLIFAAGILERRQLREEEAQAPPAPKHVA